MASFSRQGYSGLQILLHWLIAALVLFQLVFGESMVSVVDALEEGRIPDPTDKALAGAHYWIGISVLVLVVLRIVVRLVQGAPAPAGLGWQAVASKLVHGIFYLLLIAVPATGLMALYVSDAFGDIHAIGKPLFIAFIVLHAFGALYHQFRLRDGTLRRMFLPAR